MSEWLAAPAEFLHRMDAMRERLQAEETLTAFHVAHAAVPITQSKNGEWRRQLNERRRWIEHLEKLARGPQPKPEPMDPATIIMQAQLAGIPVETKE